MKNKLFSNENLLIYDDLSFSVFRKIYCESFAFLSKKF